MANILMLVHSFWPIAGGVERQALHQARELRKKGYDVRVLTAQHKKAFKTEETVEGVPIYRFPYPTWIPFKPLRKLPNVISAFVAFPKIVKSFHPDILHVHQVQWLTLLGAFYKKKYGYAIISKGTSSGERTDAAKFYNTQSILAPISRFFSLRDKVYATIDRIVCISSRMVKEFTAVGVPPEKIRYIPNGISPRPPVIRQFDSSSIEIISTFRLSPLKRPLAHIESVALAAKLLPATRIHYTNYNFGELYKDCIDFVEANNLQHIITLNDATLHETVLQHLERSDIFMNVSTTEGLSNSILEAMICRVPVIISDVGGARDLIGTSLAESDSTRSWRCFTNGILTSPIITPAELADAICYLINNPTYRQSCAANAAAHVNQIFVMDKVIAQYDELYQSLLAKKHE
jgi:glycosyltransferase involved in cell wall biosynthesis